MIIIKEVGVEGVDMMKSKSENGDLEAGVEGEEIMERDGDGQRS